MSSSGRAPKSWRMAVMLNWSGGPQGAEVSYVEGRSCHVPQELGLSSKGPCLPTLS
jgi:hypothetical protein